MKRHLPIRSLLAALAFCLSAFAFTSNDPWLRDYHQWSEKDVKKVLQDSPWTAHYALNQVILDQLGRTGQSTGREAAPTIEFQVKLVSAKPIRQALVRRTQLSPHYSQLSPEQRKAQDSQGEAIVNTEYPDVIVVNVSYTSNVQLIAQNVRLFWQKQTLETLKGSIYLIGGHGQKVDPISYNVAPGQMSEFEFTFPRNVDGKPVVAKEDKSFGFEFNSPDIGGGSGGFSPGGAVPAISSGGIQQGITGGSINSAAQTPGTTRVFVEFKVPRMVLNGELLY